MHQNKPQNEKGWDIFSLRNAYKDKRVRNVRHQKTIGLLWCLLTWRVFAQIPSSPLLTGTITHPELGEISGLARSLRHPGVWWVINDGGNWSAVYAIHETGEFLGKVPVLRSVNRDWEDLASFEWEGEPYLLIADVGDNDEKYGLYTLYLVPEPEPTATSVSPLRILHFQYEEGPKDCEAVAVDVATRSLLLITKRTTPPAVYILSMENLPEGGVLTARNIARLSSAPRPSEEQIARFPLLRHAGQPTALTLSPDGKRAAVLTYTMIWLYTRSESGWAKTFQDIPWVIPIPLMKQAESLDFSPDGRSLYLTSETLPAPIYRITLEETDAKGF